MTLERTDSAAGFSRRGFIGGSLALAGLAQAGCSSLGPEEGKTKVVPGIQLYTVRAAMAADAPGTVARIASLGYREVEFAGYFGMTPAEVRTLLGDVGMTAPSAHTNARLLREDAAPLLDAAAEIGHAYVTIPWLAPEDRASLDHYKAWAETFNKLGEECHARGMQLAYHNHDFEFEEHDGLTGFDVLLTETDERLMEFELDIYWAVKAGRDPVALFAKAPSRFTMCHVKDMDAAGDMADIGAGTIDFKAILGAPEAASMRHLFAEHDRAQDPWATARADLAALEQVIAAIR